MENHGFCFLLLLSLGPNFYLYIKILLIHSIQSFLKILAACKFYIKTIQRLKMLVFHFWCHLEILTCTILTYEANCSFYANSNTHEMTAKHPGINQEQQKINHCASKKCMKESLQNWEMSSEKLDYNDVRQTYCLYPTVCSIIIDFISFWLKKYVLDGQFTKYLLISIIFKVSYM